MPHLTLAVEMFWSRGEHLLFSNYMSEVSVCFLSSEMHRLVQEDSQSAKCKSGVRAEMYVSPGRLLRRIILAKLPNSLFIPTTSQAWNYTFWCQSFPTMNGNRLEDILVIFIIDIFLPWDLSDETYWFMLVPRRPS